MINESIKTIQSYNGDKNSQKLIISETINTLIPSTQTYAYIFTKYFNYKIYVIIFEGNDLTHLEFTPEDNSKEVEDYIVLININNVHYNLLYCKDSNFSIRKSMYDYIKFKSLLVKKNNNYRIILK